MLESSEIPVPAPSIAAAGIDTTPLSGPYGVEVHGLDLERPPSEGQRAALNQLFDRHHLLLFRSPGLSDEAQVRVAACIGPVGHQPNGKVVSYVSNARDDANPALRAGELTFHSDYTFTTTPLTAISLFAEEVDDDAVTTLFANALGAGEALDPAERQRLAALTCRQLYDPHDIPGHNAPAHRRGELDEGPDTETAFHPVIVPHPRTGAAVLYVNYAQSESVVGIPRAESAALLERLLGGLYAEDNLYEHRWRQGDLVLWDNVALQHARGDVHDDRARSLRRVVVRGTSLETTVYAAGAST